MHNVSQFQQTTKRIVEDTGDLRHESVETWWSEVDDGRRSWACVGRLFIKVCWSPSNSPDRPEPPQISPSPRPQS